MLRAPPGLLEKNLILMLQPIPDEPALLVEGSDRSLVVADLHVGIEYDLLQGGISVPTTTQTQLDHLLRLIRQESVDRLIFLGDVKHGVPRTSRQEQRELPGLFESLLDLVEVEVVPGNHDPGLESIVPRDVRIHPSKGAAIDGIGYLHGHTWPAPDILRQDDMVVAHNHPTIRLVDDLGHALNKVAWIRTHLNPEPLEEHYGEILGWSDPSVIVVPAFNDLCGGQPFNEARQQDLLGPLFYSGAISIEEAEAYLLDGTRLGRIADLRDLPLTKHPRPKK